MSLSTSLKAYTDLPRSALSKLNIHGFGTSHIESAASFTERLRAGHDVSPRQMSFFMSRGLSRYTDDVEPLKIRPDSPSEAAKAYIHRLSDLTSQRDANRLGLGALAGVVAVFGTMREVNAWCPLCVKMSVLGDRANYLPLMWSIDCVEACVLHGVVLQSRCPACAATFARDWKKALKFPFQCCNRCNATLYDANAGSPTKASKASFGQMVMAEEVGDLILQLHTSLSDATLTAPDFRRVLDSTTARNKCSGFTGFVESASISKGTGSRLLSGERCSLGTYARVATTAGVSLAGLFAPAVWELRQPERNIHWQNHPNRRHRMKPADWPRLVALANAELKSPKPRSFRQFGADQGVDLGHFKRKLGKLAQQIDAAHAELKAADRKDSAVAIAERLINAAKAMHDAGVPISRRALARRLNQGRNNLVFNKAWELATSPHRRGRLGGKSLPLSTRPGRPRSR